MKIQTNYVNPVILAVKHVLELNQINVSLVAMIQQDHWLLLTENNNVRKKCIGIEFMFNKKLFLNMLKMY